MRQPEYKTTVDLFKCPACKQTVTAQASFEMQQKDRAYAADEAMPDAMQELQTVQFSAKLKGIYMQHNCGGQIVRIMNDNPQA